MTRWRGLVGDSREKEGKGEGRGKEGRIAHSLLWDRRPCKICSALRLA